MKTYRLSTRISAEGTIEVKGLPELFEKEVDIIILPTSSDKPKKIEARAFVEKWAGVLKDVDAENSKYEYLTQKYK